MRKIIIWFLCVLACLAILWKTGLLKKFLTWIKAKLKKPVKSNPTVNTVQPANVGGDIVRDPVPADGWVPGFAGGWINIKTGEEKIDPPALPVSPAPVPPVYTPIKQAPVIVDAPQLVTERFEAVPVPALNSDLELPGYNFKSVRPGFDYE